jgi:Phosphoesterase family
MLENHTRQQVLERADAPYTAALARDCAGAADYHSVGSPSLPNYIGATSGSTHGIHDNGSPASHPLTDDNLFRQVRVSGRRAVSYQESMPGPCALSGSGRYAVRHNPAAYFTGADDRDACIRDDVPLGTPEAGALSDAIDADTLPAFTLITPDLCNDTHDCPVATGDAWLARWVPRLIGSAAYRRGTVVIFLVWDEPTPMPFVAVTPTVPPGTTVQGTIDHFSLLRTTEALLGLDLLGAAGRAPDLRSALGR